MSGHTAAARVLFYYLKKSRPGFANFSRTMVGVMVCTY